MTYLNKYQKWVENGQVGSILDNGDESDSMNQSEDEDGESNIQTPAN